MLLIYEHYYIQGVYAILRQGGARQTHKTPVAPILFEFGSACLVCHDLTLSVIVYG